MFSEPSRQNIVVMALVSYDGDNSSWKQKRKGKNKYLEKIMSYCATRQIEKLGSYGKISNHAGYFYYRKRLLKRITLLFLLSWKFWKLIDDRMKVKFIFTDE